MNKLKILISGGLISLFSLSALAEWTIIQDFENASYEDFDIWKRFPPQGDLFLSGFDPVNAANGHYFVDPGPQQIIGENTGGGGVVGELGNNQVWNIITLPTPVAEGAVVTIKYDLYLFSTGPYNINIGLSDVPVTLNESLSKADGQLIDPISYGAFESQAAITGNGFVRVRNGSAFTTTETLHPVGEWFTLYQVIDNGNDRTYLYYKTASMEVPVHIPLPDSDYAIFRNGTVDPLVNWVIISAGSNDGSVDVFLLDNLAIDMTGVNIDGGTHVGGGLGSWAGFPIVDALGNVDTGAWMGYVNVAAAPYIWSYSLNSWMYIDEGGVGAGGSWIYIFN